MKERLIKFLIAVLAVAAALPCALFIILLCDFLVHGGAQ